MMTIPDILIAGTIVLSVVIGIARGLVKESISLISWLVAIALSVLYSGSLAAYITFTQVVLIRSLIAFLLIFVSVVFIGAIINYMIGSFVRKTPFSLPDRILGSAFGFLRGIVVVSIVVLLAGLTPFPETPWWKESFSITKFQSMALWLRDRLPDETAEVFHFPGDPVISQEEAILEPV